MWRRRTALLTLPLALAGCAATRPAAPPAPAGPTAGPTTPAPDLADCGTWTLGRSDRLPAEATGCLDDALRDRQAVEMTVTAPTVEGDPVTTHYLTRVDGRVEVTVDGRQDRYGTGRVERMTCTGPVSYPAMPAFDTCTTPSPV
ncbi:DUF4362 domain-containing protein [Micromonospora sp. NPDC050686]|uniref:DUF4362 domain-containing protein n=1 Tax=Micromonospora sp. NPDC050686 TaxID=3154631 RepID=UPI0033DE5784